MPQFLSAIIDKIFEQRNRLIAFLPILFATGIGLYFSLPFETSPWLTVAVFEILIICAYFLRFNRPALVALGCLGIVVFGFSDIQLKSLYLRAPDNLMYSEQEIYLKGKIISADSNYKGKKRIILDEVTDFQNNPIAGKYRVTLNHNYNELSVGECVEVVAQTFALPTPNAVGGYQFDRKAYFEGINALGYSLADAYSTECQKEPSFSEKIRKNIYGLRKFITDKINSSMEPREAAVASALIAGDRSFLSPEISEKYQNSGLAHFLAISGLHMGIIAFLSFFFIRFLLAIIPILALKYDGKKTAAVAAIILSFIYFVISGMQVPAERAFIMTFAVMIGILFDREAISIRTISVAAFIVLLISPQALISASFQMSFAAVLAMTAFYERYAKSITSYFSKNIFYRCVLGYIAGILISDLVASLATMPFAIYHFQRIAVYTLLGNLLAAPIIGFVVMPGILLSLLLMPFGLEKLAFFGVEKGLKIINNITEYVSSLPQAGYKIAAMPFWGFMMIVIGGLWICVWTAKWRRLGLIPLVVGILSVVFMQTPDFIADKSGKVVAVKDNEGELLILPSRGENFVKNVWLEQFGQNRISPQKKKIVDEIYSAKESKKNTLSDLSCDEKKCVYKKLIEIEKAGGIEIKGKKIDTEENLGFSAYINKDKVKIKTVRDYIGRRNWNK